MDLIFNITNLTVTPFWLAMIFLPWWRVTERLLRSSLIAVAPALIYAGLMLPNVMEHAPVLLNPALLQIAGLLGSPNGAAISWAHFLTFDLLIGRWIYLDSRNKKIPGWISSPILFLTLLLGPIGFLLYLAIRGFFPGPISTDPPFTN